MSMELAVIGAKMASGLIGSFMSSKSASSQSKKEKNLLNKEYNFNKSELEKSFTTNLGINFSNTASDIFDFTKQYITQNSSINMMSARYSGGLAFSSSTKDIQNSLKSEYLTKLNETESTRTFNESQLVSQFNANSYQLSLNKDRSEYGISTALATANADATQTAINSVISGASDLMDLGKAKGKTISELLNIGGGEKTNG